MLFVVGVVNRVGFGRGVSLGELLGVFGVVILLFSGSALGQGCDLDEIFDDKQGYLVGEDPIAIGVGDFDGDGDTDIAVANRDDGDVSVLLNSGDGVFFPQLRFPVGDRPSGLLVEDVDDDGDLDLIVSDLVGADIYVLLNAGNGTFFTSIKSSIGHGQVSIALSDIDGDGRNELAVGSLQGLSLMMNLGDGVYGNQQVLYDETTVRQVLSGDIDADGDIDLVAAVWANSEGCKMRVFLNDGGGVFGDPLCETLGGWLGRMAMGDIDGDGDLDLAYVDYNAGDVVTIRHRFDGDYVNENRTSAGSRPNDLVFGDVDQDGDLDLAVSGESGIVVNVLLNFSGSFGNRRPYSVGWDSRRVAMGDLDQDGDLDLIVGNAYRPDVSILLNLCDPVVCDADLDMNGVLDIFDVWYFLAAYSLQDPVADFHKDEIWNYFDFSTFLTAFYAGCS